MTSLGYSDLILMKAINKTPAELRAAFNPIPKQERVVKFPEDNLWAPESKFEQKEIWKKADKGWCDLIKEIRG